jgi:hypothetical protein
VLRIVDWTSSLHYYAERPKLWLTRLLLEVMKHMYIVLSPAPSQPNLYCAVTSTQPANTTAPGPLTHLPLCFNGVYLVAAAAVAGAGAGAAVTAAKAERGVLQKLQASFDSKCEELAGMKEQLKESQVSLLNSAHVHVHTQACVCAGRGGARCRSRRPSCAACCEELAGVEQQLKGEPGEQHS